MTKPSFGGCMAISVCDVHINNNQKDTTIYGSVNFPVACYEDNIFYEILAEELSRRDMNYPEINEENYDEIITRMDRYMSEFQLSGVDRLVLEES